MIKEYLKVTGEPTFTLYDAQGNIKQQITKPNLVVTAGKNLIADRLIGTSSSVMSHMAVGTSNTSLDATNTALATQLGSRVSLTASRTNNVITYSCTFGEGVSTGALVEAGIFNAATSGTMLCRTTFPVINKEATDTLTINWNVTIS